MARRIVTVEQRSYTIKLYKEGDYWVAECLDPDLAAQASTAFEALNSLGSLFLAHGIGDIPDLVIH